MPRAAREEVRVVKRVLLARRGRFLLAFLGGGPFAIFRVKHRDASTSARSLARSLTRAANVEKSVVHAISGFACAYSGRGYISRERIEFSRVSPAARNPSAIHERDCRRSTFHKRPLSVAISL